jgi:hypothetical protein
MNSGVLELGDATPNGVRPHDPVLIWLNAKPKYAEGLVHSVRFVFDGQQIELASNCAEAIVYLRNHIAEYHPDVASPPDHRRASRIDIHVLGRGDGQRIALGFGRSTDVPDAVELPAPALTVRSNDFVHMKWDGVEAFWRPFDLLASMRFSESAHIRLLVGAIPDGAGESRPRALRTRIHHAQAGGDKPVFEASNHSDRMLTLEELGGLVRIMIARARGHLCLHAASVAYATSGALLMGPSGSGKTTTALALMRGGFQLLSDENSLLNVEDGRIRLAGFPVAPRIVGRAPATLDQLESTLGAARSGKSTMVLPTIATHGRGTSWSRPAAMLFLRIVPGAEDHAVRRLSPEEAFVRSTNQVLDPTNVFRKEEQAQAVINLVQQVPAYELMLCRNLARLPDLVRRLMERGA